MLGDFVLQPVDGDLDIVKVHPSNLHAELGELLHRFGVDRRDSAVMAGETGSRRNLEARLYTVAWTSSCSPIPVS